jgi:hypothetical protein
MKKIVDKPPVDVVYVTRYALTQGITQERMRPCKSYPNHWEYAAPEKQAWNWVHGKYVHPTRQAAEKHANELRKKKIASLKKQITKLQALLFAAPFALVAVYAAWLRGLM